MTINQSQSYTSESEQMILKKSRDDKYDVLAFEVLEENSAGDALIRKKAYPLPTTGNNPAITLSYDGSDNLQYVDELISGVTYRTTLTYTSGVLTNVSSAVVI